MKLSNVMVIGGSVIAAALMVWIFKNLLWISIVAVAIAGVIFMKKKAS